MKAIFENKKKSTAFIIFVDRQKIERNYFCIPIIVTCYVNIGVYQILRKGTYQLFYICELIPQISILTVG